MLKKIHQIAEYEEIAMEVARDELVVLEQLIRKMIAIEWIYKSR